MPNLNRITLEALSILKCVLEDQLEERYAYRNEIKRLTFGGLTLPFASLEHFLDRYGYLSIDQRSDTLSLSSSGLEAARHHETRLSSLDDDVLFHFAKELQDLAENETNKRIYTGKRFDQHYIRFEGIGRGGLGSVWRAEHLKSGRQVAIKTLEGIDELVTSGRKSTIKKRLERVVRQLATLNHPFICPIIDLSVHHTPPYYVMPLYQGGSLRDLLRQGPMSPEVALNLFYQICLGLKHAHAREVLHLDLKPENILLDEQGNVRIFDFGMSHTIAKQVAQHGRHSYVGLGSVAYMAPELLRDAQLESVSVDIYGLGLILYELLVGELPGRRSPMPSEVIEGLPRPIDELFDLMTQDHPDQRPQSLDAVLEVLNKVPPFDQLSSQSVVMIFTQSPLKLPGLQTLDLPELEEAEDVKELDKSVTAQITSGRETEGPTASKRQDSSGSSSRVIDAEDASPSPERKDEATNSVSGERSTQQPQESQASSIEATPSDQKAKRETTDHEPSAHLSSPEEEGDAPEVSVLTQKSDASQSSSETQQEKSVEGGSTSAQSGLDALRSRLHQSTEVIPHRRDGIEFSRADIDTATLEVDQSSHEPEFTELREEVLEELEELEELEDLTGGGDLLSSAIPNDYLSSGSRAGGRPSRRYEDQSVARFDDDDDKTELKVVRGASKPQESSQSRDRVHQWPPPPTRNNPAQASTTRSSEGAGPKRTSSIQQQIRERRERDRGQS